MENGFIPVLEGAGRGTFVSGDTIVLFLLLGSFRMEKNSYRTIFAYIVISAVLIFTFYVFFFAVFGNLGFGYVLAVGEMPLFASFPSTVGRIDWITINLWTIAELFQIGVLSSFSKFSFDKSFGIKNEKSGIYVVAAIMAVYVLVSNLNLSSLTDVVTSYTFNVVQIVFLLSLPVSLLIAIILKKENRVEFNKKIFTK
jgi:hypothetical protein